MPDHIEDGKRIAAELGVKYEGPQYRGEDEFYFNTFTDPVTHSTFGAKDLESARKTLYEMREKFAKYNPETDIKQPWQMTREEFAARNNVKKDSMMEAHNATAPIGSFEHLGEKIVSRKSNAYSFTNKNGRTFLFDIIKTERKPKYWDTPEITRYIATSPGSDVPLSGIVYNHNLKQLVAASNKEGKIGIIQRLMQEADTDGLRIDVAQPISRQGSNAWHRYIVTKALSEGKPVPEEVIRELGVYMPNTIDKSWWDANYFEQSADGERIPCVIRTDPSLDEAVKHIGYASKTVDPETEKSLQGVVMTDVELLEDSQNRLAGVQPISDNSLNSRQLANLALARAITKELSNGDVVEVCAGRIPGASDRTRTAGLYSRLEPKIYIAEDQLESGKSTVDVAVHEVSHHTSQDEDGDPGHNVEISRQASKVLELVNAGNFDEYIRNQSFVW